MDSDTSSIDTSSAITSCSRDSPTMDSDGTTSTDTSSATTSCSRDSPTMDSDTSSTDTSSAITSCSRDTPTMDSDSSDSTAADTIFASISCSRQLTHTCIICRLTIDDKASGDSDAAISSQFAPIRQNQVDIAGDRDTAGDSYITINHIPMFLTIIFAPRGITLRHVRSCCRTTMPRQSMVGIIPCVVDIINIVCRCLCQRRDRQ